MAPESYSILCSAEALWKSFRRSSGLHRNVCQIVYPKTGTEQRGDASGPSSEWEQDLWVSCIRFLCKKKKKSHSFIAGLTYLHWQFEKLLTKEIPGLETR